MKKSISLLLALTVLLSAFALITVSVAAETNELVTNGGFESSNVSHFSNGTRVGAEGGVTPASGSYMFKSSGNVMCDVADEFARYQQIQGGVYKLDYTGSVKVYAPSSSTSVQLYLKYLRIGDSCAQFIAGSTVTLTAGSWTTVTFSGSLYGAPNEKVVYALLTLNTNKTVYLDELSLTNGGSLTARVRPADIAVGNSATTEPIVVDASKRSKEVTVGAVRWDAWYKHDVNALSIAHVVEETLSSNNGAYLYRAPFFASIENKKVVLPTYSQEICDRELQYAASAGIDYFIYGWYDDGMRAPRVCHTASPYRNKVKMAIIAGNSRFEHIEMKEMLVQDYYMKVLGNRPLIYINTDDPNTVSTIVTYYRNLCLDLQRMGNDIGYPYIVVYYNSISSDTALKALYAAGADALTNYAFSAPSTGTVGNLASYSTIASASENSWTSRKAKVFDTMTQQLVPALGMGYDLSPRYYAEQKQPGIVHWMGVSNNGYAADATPAQLKQLVTDAMEFMLDENNAAYTHVNTISIYAWNEHDEGGWLCPTVKVDAQGNQLFSADGSPQIDTSRLDAVAEAIHAYQLPVEGKIENASLTVSDDLNMNFFASVERNEQEPYMAFTRDTGTPINLIPAYVSTFEGGVTSGGILTDINGGHIYQKNIIDDSLCVTYYSYAANYTSPVWKLGQLLRKADEVYGAQKYICHVSLDVKGSINKAGLVVRRFGADNDNTLQGICDGVALNKDTYTTLQGAFTLTAARAAAATDTQYGLCIHNIQRDGETAGIWFDNATLTVTPVYEVKGVYQNNMKKWCFTYEGINPQCMNDAIRAELWVDGTKVDTLENYSVRDYCTDLYANGAAYTPMSNERFGYMKTLLGALLCYGAEAQKQKEYRTDALVNEGLYWAQGDAGIEKPASYKNKQNFTKGSATVQSAGVTFSSVIQLYDKIASTAPDNITVVLSRDHTELKREALSALPQENGTYILWSNGIPATDFASLYTLSLYEGNTLLETVTYSVNSYCSEKWSAPLAKALYGYGLAARQYRTVCIEEDDPSYEEEFMD